METNQSNFPAVGGMECVTIPAFNISDEEMKAYYLKEAYLTDRHACTPNRTEFELLNILLKKQKKILQFLSKLTQFPWSETMIDLQAACLPLMVADSVSGENRLVTGRMVVQTMQGVSNILVNKDVLASLVMTYNRHYQNVRYLLRQFSEYDEKKDLSRSGSTI